ncbi:DUF6707 family protein [Arthrobacter globiformis]|uniref:Uncharacterized protein n=1 Tax=Arthrobacter globiformis TaxID=1665 RepID=A0A328HJN5_ARTGO|nr:DUF6707 family protein [Arthrobacter globiformis]RAM38826.1 hypothetical protein DBZ45_02865 [Arthrobacter globiformis]
MNHPAAAKTYREQQAGSLRAGDHLLLPDGERSAEIHSVEVETDDFGSPATILATLTGGGTLRIAAGSSVRITEPAVDDFHAPADAGNDAARTASVVEGATSADGAGTADGAQASGAQASDAGTPLSVVGNSVVGNQAPAEPVRTAPAAVVVPPLPATTPVVIGPSADDLALIPQPSGTPESVVEAVAEAHPDSTGVQLLADKLVKGINTKSGSCLKDLSDLAHELFVMLKDAEAALAVADLLNVLPFDGNPGRWGSVEASLALSSYVCRQTGHKDRAAVYEKLLRAPENQETDPFKARMQARVRQRSLNEPNLYDKEIFRSIDNSNHEAEREWRLLRLESLLFLRAHGGSQTISGSELERRIANELESVRA